MDKYLKQLLETYAKVILPSFGAIVVENEETGNLMFNEYLSYNDGKLDDLIVSESNMELQEAQNMIAKYIRDIQVQIDKGESYDIFELGRFYKNQDGEIEFEGNLKDGAKSQSKKESPKVATSSKGSESDKKKEEPPKPKEDKKEAKSEPKKEVSKKEVRKDIESESKSTEKENKFVAKKESSKQEVKKEAKPVKKEKAPKPPKKKKEKTPKDGKKKKRFGTFFWIAIIILALASAGLIYVGLNYEEVKSYMGWGKFDNKENIDSKESKEESDKTETEQQESVEFDANGNAVADSMETSNVEFDEDGNEVKDEQGNDSESETNSTPSPEPNPVTTSSTGSHHLIAGSFSNLSNAESLVKQLKSKGLNARILGEFGGLHFVSAASYNSSKEARSDIERIRQNAPGSWIFKYNNK